MAEADVVVQLKANIASFMRDMTLAQKKLKSFANDATKTKLSSGSQKLEKDLKNQTNKMKKHFDGFDKAIVKTGKVLSKVLSVAIKGTIIQMGLMAAAMLTIHASFVIGRGLMKAYSGAMKIVAQGGAAVAVALATAAAAMREQQAAMFAYKGGGAKQLGSGLNQTRAAMRSLAADANLAVIGTQGLNKSYAAMSKTMSSSQIAGSRGMFKALMDFGSAGQDPAAGAEKVAVLISVLNDAKKSIGDVQKAAKELSPEMEKAFKESGVKTKKQFKEMLMSGDLAKKGGVFGQFDTVNGTLISQAKSFFSQLKVQFEQFGDKFLNPAKKAFFEIKNIIRRDMMRVYAELNQVNTGGMFDGLVTAVEKISGLFVNLIRNWLPKAQGHFSYMGDWISNFKRGWDLVLEKLRPFIAGARVIESIFSPIWAAIKEQGSEGMKDFNKSLQDNADNFKEFGERIASLLTSVMEFGAMFRKIFMDSLPFINDVLAGVKSMFDGLKGFVSLFTGSLGGLGGLMGLMVMSKKMQSFKGGFLPGGGGNAASQNVQNMNVSNLNIANAPGVTRMGGPVPAGQPGQQGLSSGKSMPAAGYGALYAPPPIPTGPSKRPRFSTRVGNEVGWALNPAIGGMGLGIRALGEKYPQLRIKEFAARQDRLLAEGAAASYGPLGRGGITPSELMEKNPKATFRERARATRNTQAYAKLYGNAESGQVGFNQKASTKMGAGLGLALASQYAPEEMRGALALGGAVATINPLAGLAVGLGGAALTAKNGKTGALAGAGGGFMAGKMLAPLLLTNPVTAPFAAFAPAIGAALGAITGGLMGNMRKIKTQAKEARAAVNSGMDSMLASMTASRYAVMQENKKIIESGGTVKNVGAFEGFASESIDKRKGLPTQGSGTMEKMLTEVL